MLLRPGGVCHEQLLRTWKYWLNELRNSPSVMDMNMANEAYGEPQPPQLGGWLGEYFEWHDEFYKVAKQMRPESGENSPNSPISTRRIRTRNFSSLGAVGVAGAPRVDDRRLLLVGLAAGQGGGTGAGRRPGHLPGAVQQR